MTRDDQRKWYTKMSLRGVTVNIDPVRQARCTRCTLRFVPKTSRAKLCPNCRRWKPNLIRENGRVVGASWSGGRLK